MTPAREGQPLSIGALSRATRIPVETLRTWERRYGSPKPMRKPSGHRIYSAGAVEHLRRIGRLLTHGHRPGEILGLSLRELDALLALSEPNAVSGAAASQPALPGEILPARILEHLLKATLAMDRAAIMQELQMGWVRLGPLRFLEEVAGAFMVQIGRDWQVGSLDVRHEHFAFACLSDFLRAARDPYDQQARGPRVVAATLPGDHHEGGLLITSALMAVRGYRVLFLGADTPVQQIAPAVLSCDAEAVAVSVSAAMPRAQATRIVGELRDALPAGVALWMGGAGAPPVARGAERFESLRAFDDRLGTYA